MVEWERRLQDPHGPPGHRLKNQPHFNAALRAAGTRVKLLPCDLFPNGYRYASPSWRAAQRRAPISVHNNWIRGAAAKKRRFVEWGFWANETAGVSE